jgi:hypothetical protein
LKEETAKKVNSTKQIAEEERKSNELPPPKEEKVEKEISKE